jgi:hypothetical protein
VTARDLRQGSGASFARWDVPTSEQHNLPLRWNLCQWIPHAPGHTPALEARRRGATNRGARIAIVAYCRQRTRTQPSGRATGARRTGRNHNRTSSSARGKIVTEQAHEALREAQPCTHTRFGPKNVEMPTRGRQHSTCAYRHFWKSLAHQREPFFVKNFRMSTSRGQHVDILTDRVRFSAADADATIAAIEDTHASQLLVPRCAATALGGRDSSHSSIVGKIQGSATWFVTRRAIRHEQSRYSGAGREGRAARLAPAGGRAVKPVARRRQRSVPREHAAAWMARCSVNEPGLPHRRGRRRVLGQGSAVRNAAR